MDQLVADMS